MSKKKMRELDWTDFSLCDWEIERIKALFWDDTTNITVEQLARLTVDHYSIPAFDEFGTPIQEEGSAIASNKIFLRGGELLVSKLNTHKPRVWLVPYDQNIKVASTEFVALRERYSEAVSKRFFQYLISSTSFTEYISCFQTSVTNSHRRIKPEDLWRTKVPLPNLPEQKRIAAYLDACCTAIDAAVAAKSQQLETLDALRKEVIQRAVTRGLAQQPELQNTGNTWMEQVPAGWNLVCLKRVSEIQTGITLGKVYDGPVIERPYLRVANVQDGHLALDDVATIEVPLAVAERVELRVNDVLMTEGGDLDKLGRGFLWNGEIPECLHQNHIFAVRCFQHKLLPKFLTYLTASRYGRDYFEATGKRTTNLASTNSTKVGAFPLPLPPVEEQERIVAFVDNKLAEIKGIIANIQTQITTLIAYRKSLIHECVTGQRRIAEADVLRVHTQRNPIIG